MKLNETQLRRLVEDVIVESLSINDEIVSRATMLCDFFRQDIRENPNAQSWTETVEFQTLTDKGRDGTITVRLINTGGKDGMGGCCYPNGDIDMYSTVEEIMDFSSSSYFIQELSHELNHALQRRFANRTTSKFDAQRHNWHKLIFGSENSMNYNKMFVKNDNGQKFQAIANALYCAENSEINSFTYDCITAPILYIQHGIETLDNLDGETRSPVRQWDKERHQLQTLNNSEYAAQYFGFKSYNQMRKYLLNALKKYEKKMRHISAKYGRMGQKPTPPVTKVYPRFNLKKSR